MLTKYSTDSGGYDDSNAKCRAAARPVGLKHYDDGQPRCVQQTKKTPHMAGLFNSYAPGRRDLHHAAHSAHVGHAAASATGTWLFGLVGNHGFGGDQ